MLDNFIVSLLETTSQPEENINKDSQSKKGKADGNQAAKVKKNKKKAEVPKIKKGMKNNVDKRKSKKS